MMSALVFALQAATATPVVTSAPAPAPPSWPTREADYVARNVHFHSGEAMAEVRLHYTTLGQPHRNAKGEIDNAVMVLHGTGNNGHQFLAPNFADELYGPGQPLDIRKYWIILPDNIGHGKSSKPSDGMGMAFPHYDYADMVALQHSLLTDGLGVVHARLIMGTSMGCMQGFVWGEQYPGYARAVMALACEPVEIAGLNRMWRQMIVDGIEADPAWNHGHYTQEPQQGLRLAASIIAIAGAAPLRYQKLYPRRDMAVSYMRDQLAASMADMDANDLIYQINSSWDYDPWPALETIRTPMMWVNSADDFINPRNFTYPQEVEKRAPNIRFRLIPETADTHGHATNSWAVSWKADLIDLLRRTGE